MKTLRVPITAVALLVALVVIILSCLQLSTTILTFDPTDINPAVHKSVTTALSQVAVPAEEIFLIAPDGGIQTLGYLNSWSGVPIVLNYLNQLPPANIDTGPSGIVRGSGFMTIGVDTYQPSGDTNVSQAAQNRMKQLVEEYTADFINWQNGVASYAGLDSFNPSPAGQLLIAGGVIEIAVFLALLFVLVTQGPSLRITLGVIAFSSATAMALLCASAAEIQISLMPYLQKSPVEILPAVQFNDNQPGSTSSLPDAIAYYNVSSDFLARTWATAALSAVVTLLCIAILAQPAPPREWKPSWMGRSREEKANERTALGGRISPPYDPSQSTSDALEVRGVAPPHNPNTEESYPRSGPARKVQ